MKPLFVLIGTFLITLIVLRLINKPMRYQLAGRIAMACMLLFTAIAHFAFAEGMSAMIPDVIPWRLEIVIATGLLEIFFAIGLIIPHYRLVLGWILIAFFILVLPANIYASINNVNYQSGELDGPGLSYLWLRIPMQVFFIGWVYFAAIKK